MSDAAQATHWCPDCAERERALAAIRALVDEQAEDEGLWFQARTAPEAYLQQELRRLHALVESVCGAALGGEDG